MKRIFENVNTFIIVLLILIIFLSALNHTIFLPNINIYSVQSGSMEPNIPLGSLVIVQKSDNYEIGDVITVKELSNPIISVTHRIVDINTDNSIVSYVTKGDANDANDMDLRFPAEIIGKVIFQLPLLGYLISFTRTQLGLILLIIIPAIIIIFSEIKNIKKEIKIIAEKRKNKS